VACGTPLRTTGPCPTSTDQIGILLSTLREARFADNTVVIGCWRKSMATCSCERGPFGTKMNFFEPACRIPPSSFNAPGTGFAPPASSGIGPPFLTFLPTLAEIANGGSAPTYAAPNRWPEPVAHLCRVAPGPGRSPSVSISRRVPSLPFWS